MDLTKFISLATQIEYYRIVAKTFVKERGLKPGKEDDQMLEMIRERCWLGVVASHVPAQMAIIREFYANSKET